MDETQPDDLPPGRKRRPMRVQCGAKSKQSGNPCKRAPCIGRTRCHIHGGRNKGNKYGTHRLYAAFATDEEKARWHEVHAELVKDPAAALLKEAAALKVRIDNCLQRMNADGMLVSERTATKETYQDREVREDGSLAPPKSIRETQRMTQRQVDVLEPVSAALLRMAKLINDAAELRRNPPGASGRESALGMEEAARILVAEFNDTGALPAPTGDVVEPAHDG